DGALEPSPADDQTCREQNPASFADHEALPNPVGALILGCIDKNCRERIGSESRSESRTPIPTPAPRFASGAMNKAAGLRCVRPSDSLRPPALTPPAVGLHYGRS